MSNSYIKYDTKLFSDIYSTASDFITDYQASGIYSADTNNRMSTSGTTTLFYLLYAQYANSPIANYDEEQFKYKLWSIMFKYGPAWEKKLDIQNKLRNLSTDDLREGSKAINDTAQAMGDDNILAKADPTKIDTKSGTYYTKSLLDAYGQLDMILKADVSTEFVNRFKICFKQFAMPEHPVLYATTEDDDE